MIALLVATIALLAWLVYGMMVDLANQPLAYNIEYVTPVNPYLCPGDDLRYEVDLSVGEVPVALTIVESWCQSKSDGVCNGATTREYRLGVLRPRRLWTLASRTMPALPFKPGEELEFWHTTTAQTNSGTSVTGYIVGPIYMRENCEGTSGTN
jgi:hypothetical protein